MIYHDCLEIFKIVMMGAEWRGRETEDVVRLCMVSTVCSKNVQDFVDIAYHSLSSAECNLDLTLIAQCYGFSSC